MSELIQHFGIDWKLLLAQVVNFAILLILLKKFAYKPIFNMLRKRREEIEKGLRFTKDAEEKLKRVGEEREEVLKGARGEALKIVGDAEQTGRQRKDEAIKEAARKSEEVMMQAKRAIEEEKAKMGEEIYKGAEMLVKIGIAKVLKKMPSEERDAALIKTALHELRSAGN